LQQPASARQTRHDGADRHADDVGDLAIGEVIHLAQDQDFAIGWQQFFDGSIEALGIAPEDVTAVANTHLHADHCGGNTVREGDRVVPAFPNARYYVQAGEYAVAMHPNERTRGTYFADNFAPLEASGQLELVTGEQELVDGVHFLPTPGHTADHASIVLASNGETGIYTGDLVHNAVQAERPSWIAAFDVLPLVTLESKKRFVERAVRERALLICGHNAFPGVGRLTEHDGKRTFVAE